MKRFILLVSLIAFSGCKSAPATPAGGSMVPNQIRSAATLRATAEDRLVTIEEKGAKPQAPETKEAKRCVQGLEVVTGPGTPLKAGEATQPVVDKEKERIQKELDAAAVQLAESAARITELEAELSSTSRMYEKLVAVGIIGVIVIVLMLWGTATRPFAPTVGIGFGGLATIILIRAVMSDILWVAGVCLVLITAWHVYLYSRAKKAEVKSTNVTGALVDTVENRLAIALGLTEAQVETMKQQFQLTAGDAGVQTDLKKVLETKGYSQPPTPQS